MTPTSAGRGILRSFVILALATSGACSLFGSDHQDQGTASGSSTATNCATSFVAETAGVQGDDPASVSGDASGDVWAVGTHWRSTGRGGPLATRWDGSTWTPDPLTADAYRVVHLEDVDVLAKDDVWAVGSGERGSPAILHLDGNEWRRDATVPDSPQSDLLGVSAVSADQAWAVGSTAQGGTDQALTLHRQGGGWVGVAGADAPGIGSLLSDVASDGDAVWAVGSWLGADRRYHALAERWDGTRWRVVPTPAFAGDSLLSHIAFADGAVWAVGWSWSDTQTGPIVLRSDDGGGWIRESLPGDDGARTQAKAIAVVDGGVVVVGRARDATGIFRPVAYRWDGSTWTEVGIDVPGAGNGGLTGVTSLGGHSWLAVGSMGGEGGGGSFTPIAARGC